MIEKQEKKTGAETLREIQTKKDQSLKTFETNYRMADLMQLFGIGRSTVYDLMKRQIIPQPIKLGRSSVWLRSEVDSAIEKLKNERGNV